MSRQIRKEAAFVSPEFQEKQDDKLLLLKKEYKTSSDAALPGDPVLILRVTDDKLTYAGVDKSLLLSEDDRTGTDQIGDIYIGQITNIVGSHGIFVRIREGKAGTDREKEKTMGYLEVAANSIPILCNGPCKEALPEALHVGDRLLVQIKQLPQKNKLMTLSSTISLPGRYLVLDSTGKGLTFSAKLSAEDKRRLEEMLKDAVKPFLQEFPCRIMVRTLAGEASEDALFGELSYLEQLFKKILTQGVHHGLYERIFSGMDPLMDYLIRKCPQMPSEVLTDDPEVYKACENCFSEFGIQEELPLRLYEEKGVTLSQVYGLREKLDSCRKRILWLKGGGSIIIDQTEAMTVIDVNSSKDIKKEKKNAQTSRTMDINVEAAREAMDQIQLRNLSGMILIDFINMDGKTVPLFLQELKKVLEIDRGRTRFIDYTKLGIVELTREKQDKPLAEELVDICLD
ncbi:MAG: ribonuclease E/G [Lachnospiraceae bacterium]|nr:ribonuclease E/G [Lachnospiraceae bacterium]